MVQRSSRGHVDDRRSGGEAELRYHAADYQQRHWVLLPGLVPKSALPVLVHDALAAPARRVTVGNNKERWTEHAIDGSCALGEFLESACVFDLAQAASDVPLTSRPAIWAQSYVAGERIAWHCDSIGQIQLLLCLEAPVATAGGLFCMRVDETEVRIALEPADALLFRASEIPHSTTRLTVTPDHPQPRRITAAARFFAAPKCGAQSHLQRFSTSAPIANQIRRTPRTVRQKSTPALATVEIHDTDGPK